jgi:hypothetical protein
LCPLKYKMQLLSVCSCGIDSLFSQRDTSP